MTALVIIEGVIVLLLLVLVAGLLKSHAEILRELHRLGGDVGSPSSPRGVAVTGLGEVPLKAIDGLDTSGQARRVSLVHGKGETLIAFLSSGCSACLDFWSELGERPAMPTETTRPVIVTRGPENESPSSVRELAPRGVPVVMSSEAWDAFKVPMTPFFMLVDGKGSILGEGSALSWGQLLGLLDRSMQDLSDPVDVTIAPDDPSLFANPTKR